MQSISRPRRALRVLAQRRQPVGVQRLVLAAARDGDQVAKPRAPPAPGSGRATPCARGAVRGGPAVSYSRVSPALPRLGSFSSRSASCLLHRRLRRRARARPPARAAAPGRGQHPVRRRRAPPARRARRASASARGSAPRPASRAARSASPPARRAHASAVSGATPSASAAPRRAPAGSRRSGSAGSATGSSPAAVRARSWSSTKCANGGGLLERLQQRVLGLVVHAVRVRDHEHARARLERPQRRLAHDLRRARRRRGCRARRAARPTRCRDARPTAPAAGVLGILGVTRDQRRRELPRRRALAAAGRARGRGRRATGADRRAGPPRARCAAGG